MLFEQPVRLDKRKEEYENELEESNREPRRCSRYHLVLNIVDDS